MNAKTGSGAYAGRIIGSNSTYQLEKYIVGSNLHTTVQSTMIRTNQEATSQVFEEGKYYQLTIKSIPYLSSFDGTAYYINGLLSAETNTSASQSRIANFTYFNLNAPYDQEVTTNAYLGSYPEVAYWNRPLSNLEIKAYYNSMKTKWGSLVA